MGHKDILCHICINLYYRRGVLKSTVKHLLSKQIQQDIFWAFQTGGCLLLHESSEGMHELSALL